VDTPAAAGEQLILGPSLPGDPPVIAQAAPGVPPAPDPAAPPASRADATQCPAATSPARDSPPSNAAALAQFIAAGRKPRSLRFAELEPYRDVLLAERRTGASIRLMARSLAKVGVTISEETLRVWLLRQKMPKRRRPRKKTAAAASPPIKPAAVVRPVVLPPLSPAPTAYTPRRGPRIARDDF
jgi:hypothetical protein